MQGMLYPRHLSKKQTLLALFIFVLLILFGLAIYWQQTPKGTSGVVPGGSTVSGITFVGGQGDVEVVGATPPPTDRPIVITANLPEDAKVILRSNLEQQMAILKKEPNRVDIWLQVGVNRKIAGDFEGAIEAWDYVAAAAPSSTAYVAWGNLADLHMYFLKDYVSAEKFYKEAIRMNPKVTEYYRAMFYLYKDINKDKAAASAILEQGLVSNPNNSDLLKLQQELKGV